MADRASGVARELGGLCLHFCGKRNMDLAPHQGIHPLSGCDGELIQHQIHGPQGGLGHRRLIRHGRFDPCGFIAN